MHIKTLNLITVLSLALTGLFVSVKAQDTVEDQAISMEGQMPPGEKPKSINQDTEYTPDVEKIMKESQESLQVYLNEVKEKEEKAKKEKEEKEKKDKDSSESDVKEKVEESIE